MRLDRALHARGLARSRSHAQDLIGQGVVTVNGAPATRSSVSIDDHDVVALREGADVHYVSRAAHKLLGALDACAPLGLNVAGTQALDAGASTGGFTQVLLERGAAHVRAVDVGHGQLAPELLADARVTAVEGCNVRELRADSPGAGVDLVVADLSFISLKLVAAPLVAFASADADFVLMVKPQFEVGRSGLSSKGVVADRRKRIAAVQGVADELQTQGLTIHHVARSALPGPQGNVEYFLWARGAWQASGHDHTGAKRPVLDGDALAAAIATEVNDSA